MVENTRCVFDRTASVCMYGRIRDSEHEPGWNSERRRAYLADYADEGQYVCESSDVYPAGGGRWCGACPDAA